MFTFYVHFAKPSSRLGMYITTAPIVGLDCVQAETADEFTELIKHQNPEFVMFQVGVSFPRRPVDVDNPQLYKHINRMIKVWSKGA